MSDLSPEVWAEVESTAKDCQRKWGMGYPVISVRLLRDILGKHRRSSQQNRLLWSLYGDIIERGGEAMAGWKADDLHEFFLIDHFGSETHEMFGRKRLKPLRRSSRLSKVEFGEFVDHIVQFMAERGVVLELPGDL